MVKLRLFFRICLVISQLVCEDMEDYLGTAGSETDKENVLVEQLPPIAPSTRDDNCHPQVLKSLPQQ